MGMILTAVTRTTKTLTTPMMQIRLPLHDQDLHPVQAVSRAVATMWLHGGWQGPD